MGWEPPQAPRNEDLPAGNCKKIVAPSEDEGRAEAVLDEPADAFHREQLMERGMACPLHQSTGYAARG